MWAIVNPPLRRFPIDARSEVVRRLAGRERLRFFEALGIAGAKNFAAEQHLKARLRRRVGGERELIAHRVGDAAFEAAGRRTGPELRMIARVHDPARRQRVGGPPGEAPPGALHGDERRRGLAVRIVVVLALCAELQ